jgi:hypothetical protein
MYSWRCSGYTIVPGYVLRTDNTNATRVELEAVARWLGCHLESAYSEGDEVRASLMPYSATPASPERREA